jgi:hypothetical protein
MTFTPTHESDYILICPLPGETTGSLLLRYPKNRDLPVGYMRVVKINNYAIADHNEFLFPKYWSIPLYGNNLPQQGALDDK